MEPKKHTDAVPEVSSGLDFSISCGAGYFLCVGWDKEVGGGAKRATKTLTKQGQKEELKKTTKYAPIKEGLAYLGGVILAPQATPPQRKL